MVEDLKAGIYNSDVEKILSVTECTGVIKEKISGIFTPMAEQNILQIY